MLLIVIAACNTNDKTNKASLPPMPFNKSMWHVKDSKDGSYVHRSKMINDLLHNYQWKGVTKDSVIQMLGQPSEFVENSLFYNYKSRQMLLGTANESIVFQLSPDGQTVTEARLSDGGFD